MKCHERRAHRRTERVTIQRIKADAAATGHGEVDTSDDANWEDVATRWARVSPQSSAEKTNMDQQIATTAVEFEFGCDAITAGIQPINRLKHRGLVYEIDTIRNLEMRNQVMLITGVLIE